MRRDIIVIGASAGGVEALRAVVGGLPPDLPATVLVVLHVPAYGGSVLPAILSRGGVLPARHAESFERLEHGTILVAPPDRHLVLLDDAVRLTRGPRENGHRPAIDVLFRTAARNAGARIIGVVLSGVLDDGTSGLHTIVQQGGLAIVQDPADALYAAMPRSALAHTPSAAAVAAKEIGPLLAQLCQEQLPVAPVPVSPLLVAETDLALMDEQEMNEPDRPGEPSPYSCPDCNGVLFEIRDGHLVRYRCRVGHAWSQHSLLGEQHQQLEAALWMALRGLEEKAALSKSMGTTAEVNGNVLTARRFLEQADEATQAASLIRRMLETQLGSFADEAEGSL